MVNFDVNETFNRPKQQRKHAHNFILSIKFIFKIILIKYNNKEYKNGSTMPRVHYNNSSVKYKQKRLTNQNHYVWNRKHTMNILKWKLHSDFMSFKVQKKKKKKKGRKEVLVAYIRIKIYIDSRIMQYNEHSDETNIIPEKENGE